MPTETIIRTLKESKEDNPKHILPRTVLKAVADEGGNFISSDVTAQDINNLHGKTFVTAEQQILTDAQKAQARQNINATAPDGYYGDSGGVFQYSTNFLGKNTPQNASNVVFRPTASQMSGQDWSRDSISGQTATIEKIKGKTLVFNQQLPNGNFASTSGWESTRASLRIASNKAVLYNLTSSPMYFHRGYLFVKGHTYLFAAHARRLNDYNFSFRFQTAPNNGGINGDFHVLTDNWELYTSIIAIPADTTASIGTFTIRGAVGLPATTGDFAEFKNLMLIDLTKMYGSGREPTTVEEFWAQFPLDFYQFSQGELVSFNGTGLKTTGFNQLYPDGHIDVLAGLTYKIEGTYTSLKDSAGNDVTVTNGEFTPTANDTYTMVGGTCVHLKWSGVRDGDTEEHWNSTLSLPITDYFEDGMKSAPSAYDELTKDKATKRVGKQTVTGAVRDTITLTGCKTSATEYVCGSGDIGTLANGVLTLTKAVNNVDVYFALETEVETPINPPLNLTYRCDDFGTEMLLPQNDDEPVTAPMDADIIYQLDYEADVRNMDVNMISKESMDNFISAFNSSGLGTITQTWDATNKKYNYTVTAPQPVEQGGETV